MCIDKNEDFHILQTIFITIDLRRKMKSKMLDEYTVTWQDIWLKQLWIKKFIYPVFVGLVNLVKAPQTRTRDMRMRTWTMIMTELQNVNCFPRIKSLAQFFYEAWVEIFTLNLNILREKIVKGQSNGRLPRKSTLKVFVLDIAQIGCSPCPNWFGHLF